MLLLIKVSTAESASCTSNGVHHGSHHFIYLLLLLLVVLRVHAAADQT
jgi:hypothetical protein